MSDVYLHIGLPKTGTTTIQAALDLRADDLRASGVLYPGGRHRQQRRASFDLVGQRVAGDDAAVAGAFARLVDEMSAHDGPGIIVSDEELTLARPRHVRRIVRSLPAHRLHVVIGVRDVARTLVSAWQQSVVMGSSCAWEDYVAGVRGADDGAAAEGLGFWLRQDLLRVMDVWETAVARERIRLVTVPPRGAARHLLLQRFAAAFELPPDFWDGVALDERNAAFGPAELEVLRRLNERIVDPLTARQHRFVVENGLRPGSRRQAAQAPVLPAEHRPWARAHAEDVVRELRRRGVRVFGELTDLLPEVEDPGMRGPDDVTAAEVHAATESALASLALAHGRLSRRQRPVPTADDTATRGTAEALGSASRRVAFRLAKATKRRAGDNRAVARVVQRYVRRRGPDVRE